jgi:hypothetical protein
MTSQSILLNRGLVLRFEITNASGVSACASYSPRYSYTKAQSHTTLISVHAGARIQAALIQRVCCFDPFTLRQVQSRQVVEA